ncbi:MAG: hypothetical protein ABIP94_02650, partial [Planctomycetota bacterium]
MPSSWRDYAVIFLMSCAVMLFQIAITRVLSVIVWYHFAFLIISIVMLGLGAPGVWFALIRRPQRFLLPCLWLGGACLPAAVICLLSFGAELIGQSVLYLIAFVLPAMLALGAVVCLLLMKATDAAISRMYGIDLLGACTGALLIVPLLNTVPTPHLIAGSGLLPLLGLALYPGRWRPVAAATAVAIVVVMAATDWLSVGRNKVYDERVIRPIYEKWTPTARITVFDESFFYLDSYPGGFGWGLGTKNPGEHKVRQYWLEQDGSAGTPITEFHGDLSKLSHLLFDVTTIGYQARQARRVAIVGGGGGRDILSALVSGADDIEVIEINPHTIEAVSTRFAALSGDIYHAPGVTAFAAEGRSHLTHSRGGFDLIQISLIDSWAASAAGAFALAENNLYTIEAFQLYLDRLGDEGLLSTSRWMVEMPRLLVLAHSALAASGVAHPEQHMLLTHAQGTGTLLLSKSPFSVDVRKRVREVCALRGFETMDLNDTRGSEWLGMPARIAAGDYNDLVRIGLSTVAPVDDSPYFFHTFSPFSASEPPDLAKLAGGLSTNVQAPRVLQQAMLWVTGLAMVLFFLPFVHARLRRRTSATAAPAPRLRATIYFAAIGAGFMLFENMLVQRFVLYLGHPSYAATVILAALLLGMGLGSTVATKFGVHRLQRLGVLVPLLLVVLVAATPSLFTATLGLPLGLRIAASLLLLAPAGGMLGLFFPLGMLHFGDAMKPWYWAINGAFGVVASVMSLALSMEFGF